MKLSKEEVLNLAKLAHLELSDQELAIYQKQLLGVLAYVNKVNSLDLSAVRESLTGTEENLTEPRQDIVEESRPAAIKQAARLDNEYLSSPAVFGDKE